MEHLSFAYDNHLSTLNVTNIKNIHVYMFISRFAYFDMYNTYINYYFIGIVHFYINK